MHTPQPKIYDLAETATFGIFRGRNARGRNVRAETSVAEMSYIRSGAWPNLSTTLFKALKLLICHFK